MSLSTLSPGKTLLSLTQLAYSLGSFIADYNETHVLNPRWPPHARFHNGQTMSLSVMLSVASLYHLWRSKPSSSKADSLALAKSDVFTAALIGSMYTAAGLTAIWYPGTAWVDAEFLKAGDSVRPQLTVFGGILGLVWVGFGLERWRLSGIDGGKVKSG